MTPRRNPLYGNPLMDLIDPVVNALFEDERNRLTKQLEEMTIQNHRLGGSKDVFVHNGEVLSHLKLKDLREHEKRPLHRDLWDWCDEWIQLRDNLEGDATKLRQALTVVFPKCRSKQHIRDVLPETMVSMVDTFRGMERQDQEGFLLDEYPLLKGQFGRVGDIVDYYLANRLLY